jgi:NTP pyrophosphatase (non-canonical NTP hydrolase)
MLTFHDLAEANIKRQREIDPDHKLSLLFKAVELAGEAGEACNVIKKLVRESLGIAGSRASLDDLGDELADTVICASIIAAYLGINLDHAIIKKFNEGTDKRGLKTRLLG